jgi:hypothetical protein
MRSIALRVSGGLDALRALKVLYPKLLVFHGCPTSELDGVATHSLSVRLSVSERSREVEAFSHEKRGILTVPFLPSLCTGWVAPECIGAIAFYQCEFTADKQAWFIQAENRVRLGLPIYHVGWESGPAPQNTADVVARQRSRRHRHSERVP